ncbi:Bug family tripartite tricarboxylate transporter substrate binding protein [Sabulicella glaciei]|uniref:Tripartite tricarboxylate transporter substrate binding protein n=1 Tax=Sabulicella glaciei TaxID=2984948 RepID=A0ABT3NV76_9PROT|nr:tripartite tricarboxylate transporter substrate binding protein [Roseococcus sp. MDT2-1-1]MCW8086070.1 tripartite tricarboxylate transporter substrate binding protein [Roseococcus sp. MDT2-1-1]
MMQRRALLALPLALPALAPKGAAAQDSWPSNRPISLIGGFPNGSGVDIYQRRLAEPLSRALGQTIVVDNRTGAGGNIGSDFVAKARPDGYTFYFGTAGTHAINASLYRTLPFDVVRDFTPIAHLGDVPNVLTVSPERRPQYTDCQAVLQAARANPGHLNYASTGNGASTHLAGAQFANAANVDVTHIPYRGQPGAQTALLAGDVDFFFNQTGPAIGAIRQGQVRGLAVTTAERVPSLPDIPTVAEACNLPGFVSTTWYGLFGPANLPPAIVSRMSEEVNKVLADPEFQRWLVQEQGISLPPVKTPQEFAEIQRRDIARWAEVVRRSGATVD